MFTSITLYFPYSYYQLILFILRNYAEMTIQCYQN